MVSYQRDEDGDLELDENAWFGRRFPWDTLATVRQQMFSDAVSAVETVAEDFGYPHELYLAVKTQQYAVVPARVTHLAIRIPPGLWAQSAADVLLVALQVHLDRESNMEPPDLPSVTFHLHSTDDLRLMGWMLDDGNEQVHGSVRRFYQVLAIFQGYILR